MVLCYAMLIFVVLQTFLPFLSLFPIYFLLLQMINSKNTYARR